MKWHAMNKRKKNDIDSDPVGWEFPNEIGGQLGIGLGTNDGGPCFIAIYEGSEGPQRYYARFEDIAADFWKKCESELE